MKTKKISKLARCLEVAEPSKAQENKRKRHRDRKIAEKIISERQSTKGNRQKEETVNL